MEQDKSRLQPNIAPPNTAEPVPQRSPAWKRDSGGVISATAAWRWNQGTIKANNTSSALKLVGAPATNTAMMEATGGATLTVENTLNNTGGTIQAQNGSTVLIQNGTVSGGTLSTSGSG